MEDDKRISKVVNLMKKQAKMEYGAVLAHVSIPLDQVKEAMIRFAKESGKLIKDDFAVVTFDQMRPDTFVPCRTEEEAKDMIGFIKVCNMHKVDYANLMRSMIRMMQVPEAQRRMCGF